VGHGAREGGAGVGTVGGDAGRSGGAEGRRADGLRGADVLSPKVGRALRFSLASGSPSPLLDAQAGGGMGARGSGAGAKSIHAAPQGPVDKAC
jgi:hypothetical protein